MSGAKATPRKQGSLSIGLDVDNVLAKTNQSIIAEHNLRTGQNHSIKEMRAWDSTKWGGLAMPLKDFLQLHDQVWKEKWAEIEPSVGPKLVYELCHAHKVEILTHRPADHQESLNRWLKMNFPEVKFNIKCVTTPEQKIHSGHDVLFDDGNPIAEELIRQGRSSDTLLYLVLHPWNRYEYYERLSSQIVPVRSLKDGIKQLMRNA